MFYSFFPFLFSIETILRLVTCRDNESYLTRAERYTTRHSDTLALSRSKAHGHRRYRIPQAILRRRETSYQMRLISRRRSHYRSLDYTTDLSTRQGIARLAIPSKRSMAGNEAEYYYLDYPIVNRNQLESDAQCF